MSLENTSIDSEVHSPKWPEYNEVQIRKDTSESHEDPSATNEELVATFISEDPNFPNIRFNIRPPIIWNRLPDEQVDKKPLNKFFVFNQPNRKPFIKLLNGIFKHADVEGGKAQKGKIPVILSSKLLSLTWATMTEAQKTPYLDEATRRKRQYVEALFQGRVTLAPRRPPKKAPSKKAAPPAAPQEGSTKTEEKDAVAPTVEAEAAPTAARPATQVLEDQDEACQHENELPPRAQLHSLARRRYEGSAPALDSRPRADPHGRPITLPPIFDGGPDASVSSLGRRGPAALMHTAALPSERDFNVYRALGMPPSYPANPHARPCEECDQRLAQVNRNGGADEYEGDGPRPAYGFPGGFGNYRSVSPFRVPSMRRTVGGRGIGPAPLARSGTNDTMYSTVDGGNSAWSRPDTHKGLEEGELDSSWLSGSEC